MDKIVILDCCNSGKFGTPQNSGGKTTAISEGVSILTSSREDELSLEGNQYSLFTSLILDALQGEAADLQGNITPGSLYAYVDRALGPWNQRPIFKTHISRLVPLRKVKPQIPIEILRKITEYFPNYDNSFPLNPSFEFTNTKETLPTVVEPFAKKENVEIFKNLQKFQSVGLVKPVDEEHMYFAAMNGKSCELTPLGYHYWRLIKNKKI